MAIRCLTALVLAIVLAMPASAAKWEGGCPPVKSKLARVGRRIDGPTPYSFSRIFEHVGHEFTIQLPKTYEVEKLGGFSTEPDGNTLEVTFTPPQRAPTISLPPIPVTATSPTTLTIVIPDSRPLVGRLLVGNARLVVNRGTTELFEIYKMVILPPMNDVRALATQGYEAELLAAVDRRGSIWIPLGFSGFGGEGESLPACPTELTPVTAFAVDLSLKKDDDLALPYVSFGTLKKNVLYLGDYLLFGENMYGNPLSTKLDVSPLAGHGIVLCALNDAIQLVVMFRLKNPALGKKSVLLPLVTDGSPVTVKLENISAEVAPVLERVQSDAISSSCYQTP